MAELAHASSLRFLAAVIAGYDVTTRIGEAVDSDQLYLRGFHPTAVCGVFGAAAAAAFVLGLDAATTTHALGIGPHHRRNDGIELDSCARLHPSPETPHSKFG